MSDFKIRLHVGGNGIFYEITSVCHREDSVALLPTPVSASLMSSTQMSVGNSKVMGADGEWALPKLNLSQRIFLVKSVFLPLSNICVS